MRNFSKLFVLLLVLVASANLAYSHCQIPCGIFGDYMRVDLLREHIATIEKSMNQINELSKSSSDNMNQLVRWVNNKEQHADEFTEIVTYYFLSQRVKIADPGKSEEFKTYQKKVTLLHQMMVFSMKAKQTTDTENTKKLSGLVNQFVDIYFTAEQKAHLKEHSKNH
jgi:nickel superoxide dismutase